MAMLCFWGIVSTPSNLVICTVFRPVLAMPEFRATYASDTFSLTWAVLAHVVAPPAASSAATAIRPERGEIAIGRTLATDT